MDGCHSTNSYRPGEEWVLQHLFPGIQKGQWRETDLESEVLQLKCLQDLLQNGDSAIHHRCQVPTPVDGQHGSQGCLLPHSCRQRVPSVPQIQMVVHKLPIWNSSI